MTFDRLNEPAALRSIQLLKVAFPVLASVGRVEEVARENQVVTGSTTPLPASERRAKVFNQNQDRDISVQVKSGYGGKIRDASLEVDDIGTLHQETKRAEAQQFEDHFVEYLASYDAVADLVSRICYAGMRVFIFPKTNFWEVDDQSDLDGHGETMTPAAEVRGSGTGDAFKDAIMGSSRAEDVLKYFVYGPEGQRIFEEEGLFFGRNSRSGRSA